MTAATSRRYGFYAIPSRRPNGFRLPALNLAEEAPAPRRRGPKPDTARTEAMYADYCAGLTIHQVAEKWGCTYQTVYQRFRRRGLALRRSANRGAATYYDYCTGMSVAQVAEKWGVSEGCVRAGFQRLGVPLRSQRGCPSRTYAPAVPFREANRVRAAEAGERRAAAAQAALPLVTDARYRSVLELRIEHPTATLAELGARHDPPITKHTYAALLRRALKAGQS